MGGRLERTFRERPVHQDLRTNQTVADVVRDYETTLAFSSFSTALAEFPTFLTAALSCSGETPNF